MVTAYIEKPYVFTVTISYNIFLSVNYRHEENLIRLKESISLATNSTFLVYKDSVGGLTSRMIPALYWKPCGQITLKPARAISTADINTLLGLSRPVAPGLRVL